MAWLSRNNFTSGEAMSHAYLNNLANDIRAWGADVNGGGYSLTNAKFQATAGSAAAPSVTTGGDTNTGVWFPAADRVGISTGGVNRLTVDEAGRVGINNSGFFAQVNIEHSTTPTAGFYLFLGAQGDHYYTCGNSGIHLFRAGEVNKMIITNAGRVGIGVDSPTAQAHVQGVGQTTAALADGGALGGTIYLQDAGAGGGNGGAALFGASQGHFAAIKGMLHDGAGATLGHIAISTRNATGDSALTERVRVTHQGRVGIGKQAPGTVLAVSGLPVHADNAAATGAGLTAGDFYRTAAGLVGVTF